MLWRDRSELEVLGRGNGGVSWVVGWDAPESEVDEVAAEMLLSPVSSGLLRGASRGLGAADGFALAARLCA